MSWSFVLINIAELLSSFRVVSKLFCTFFVFACPLSLRLLSFWLPRFILSLTVYSISSIALAYRVVRKRWFRSSHTICLLTPRHKRQMKCCEMWLSSFAEYASCPRVFIQTTYFACLPNQTCLILHWAGKLPVPCAPFASIWSFFPLLPVFGTIWFRSLPSLYLMLPEARFTLSEDTLSCIPFSSNLTLRRFNVTVLNCLVVFCTNFFRGAFFIPADSVIYHGCLSTTMYWYGYRTAVFLR